MKISSVLKYTFSTVAFILLIGISANAQVAGGKYQKLMDLYLMGKFEDCYNKALKMTENDKYRSESEPFLWVSMSLYEISMDQDLFEYYPKAVKDMLKFGVKFKKKDDKIKSKDGDYLFDGNEDFIYSLIEIALVEAKSFVAMDNYSKAAYYYKTAYQLDPVNMETKLTLGVAYMYNKNTKEGKLMIAEAMDYFKEQSELGGYEPKEKIEMAFVDGFVYYTKYLISKGQSDEAFNVVALGLKLQPKNPKFIALYKQLSE